MVRNLASILVLCVLAGLWIAGCDDPGVWEDPLTLEERAWLEAHEGEIGMFYWFNSPPYGYYDAESEYVGLFPDYVDLLEKTLHFKFEKVWVKNMQELLEAFEQGDGDVIIGIQSTPERMETMLFTSPVFDVPYVMIMKQSVDGIQSLDDMEGMKVGVMKGYVAETYLMENYPGVVLEPVASNLEGLLKVSFGEIDSFFSSVLSASSIIEKEQIGNLKIVGGTGFVNQVSIAVRKDQTVLRDIMDKASGHVSEKGFQRILNKWIHLDMPWFLDRRVIIGGLAVLVGTVLTACLVIFLNYSLRRLVLDRTAELKVELEERVRAETELKKTLNVLSSKNEELESIVYVGSHDLRSPLVNIQCFGGELQNACGRIGEILTDADIPDELRQRLLEIFDNEVATSLGFVSKNIVKLDALMRGLLSLSELGRFELNKEQIDMNTLIGEVIRDMACEVDQAGAEIAVKELPGCYADRSMMVQVFRHLLDNALKYRSGDRSLQITICGEVDVDGLLYKVSDNGIGIASDHQDKVFEVFHRLDPEDGIGGIGIGSTVVKRVVQRHGGRVWVESGQSNGATFFVMLPNK